MAKFYVFSHITGKYIFDGNYKIVERVSNVSDSMLSYHFVTEDDVYVLNDFSNLSKAISCDASVELRENTDYTRISKALVAVSQSAKLDSSYDQRVMSESVKSTSQLIRDSVTKDNLLIQAINAIDEINKAANLLSKRMREWYSLYLPEASKRISDHDRYVKIISTKTKEQLMIEFGLSDSLGADVSGLDVEEMIAMAKQISGLYDLKERYTDYVKRTVNELCPNTSYYLSEMVCARLISCAGSFKRLANFPASTIQLLGAEKALFRFLKDRSHKNPKYGIMYQHPLMSKVGAKDRGRLARILGNYAAMSLKVDYNSNDSNKLDLGKVEIMSKHLRRFVEERKISMNTIKEQSSQVD